MYPLVFHPGLAARWAGFSFDRRILMIANELNRAKNLVRDSADRIEGARCLERAFELIDLTVDDTSRPKRYELLRFRELLGQLYYDMMFSHEPLKNDALTAELMKLLRVLLTLDKTSFASQSAF
jgi:hypothetical protein